MNICELWPELLKDKITLDVKAGDVLIFNSFITHGPSDNNSDSPQLCCFSNLAPYGYLTNPPTEVLAIYLNGTHPKNYAHFFTGNSYSQSVIHARSPRPHQMYPLDLIGRALVGAESWTDPVVIDALFTLFSSTENEQIAFIKTWKTTFVETWKFLVEMQIKMHS